MDMTRHLRRWINDTELLKMGARYEGIIEDVVEEKIHNRYTRQKSFEPVIVFDDGWRLVPNIGMRRMLIDFFGPETDEWRGQRIIVFRHRVERPDPKTGEIVVRWEKRVARAADEARRLRDGGRHGP